MPAARTGRAPIRRIDVIRIDQAKRGTRSRIRASERMFMIVTTKLIDAAMDETPAKWRDRIARSTAALAWAMLPERGGYTVQPVATPPSVKSELSRKKSAGGRSQKLRLLRRGNAMSGAQIIIGMSQLPKPPMKTGITRKKIIRKAWAVTAAL